MSYKRSYYSNKIQDFLKETPENILGIISKCVSSPTPEQVSAWELEIQILKTQLKKYNISSGRIIFEYIIPRIGNRIDTVILYKQIVFILEFKCGDKEYRPSTYDQVYDYALDLRYFHKETGNKLLLVPMAISTDANKVENRLEKQNKIQDNIVKPVCCNAKNIGQWIQKIAEAYQGAKFKYLKWEKSDYQPTPTIVEAARILYRDHTVDEITRNDAGVENLINTKKAINKIIEDSKKK